MKTTVKKRIAAAVSAVSMLSGLGVSVSAADNPVSANTAKLTVNVSDVKGDIIHGAGGFLYGIADEGVPTSNTLVPLKPKVLATGTMLTTEHPYGDAEKVAEQFLEAGGEQVMMYLPNYYGYALGVSADYREYAKVMRDKVVPHIVQWKENWKKEHGVLDGTPDELAQRIDIDEAIIYLPINEGAPRVGAEHFGLAWLEYYKAITEVDPNATIGGTNEWNYNQAFGTITEDGNVRDYEWKDFLPFCIENDCMPDIITWHELDVADLRDMEGHNEHFARAWETAYKDAGLAVPELPQIVINEYATMDDCGVPGRLVNWIARFEDNGYYACLPFWHQGNSLNDLASDANEGSASWWTYKWYGDMSGKLLGVESNTDYDELYGLSTIDNNKQNIKILLGGCDGRATVQLNDVTSGESFKDSEKVHIKVESSDYAGMIGTQFETDTVLEGNFPVSDDGCVSFDLDNMKFSTSFYVTVTPAADDADMSVKYTAPYIGYYEAEDAQVSGGAENCNRYIGGSYWGASSYISDDGLVYMRKKDSELTYTINVPKNGRYELNFIYGNGQGTTRNDPEGSLSLNLYQSMSVDGGAAETLTMNNTLLTNTTGAKRVFLDLTAGEHTIQLTSLQDGELLHDLLVVKYKGEYGKDIIFDKTYEAEDADFNELIGNTTTLRTVNGKGTSYITGLSDKKVTEGGGARMSVVVRESGMYDLAFRYRSGADGRINVYHGNTAVDLTNFAAAAEIRASADWTVSGVNIYLEKGINIIDIDADTNIDLDSMRVYETSSRFETVSAAQLIPEEYKELYTLVESPDAENGVYLSGMRGADTAKGSGSGVSVEISKKRTQSTVSASQEQTAGSGLTGAEIVYVDGIRTAKAAALSETDEAARFFAAVYDRDGRLAGIGMDEVDLTAGESTEVSAAVPEEPEGGKTVLYLWDGKNKPLSGAVEAAGTAAADRIELTAEVRNTGSEERTVKLGALLNNTEYAEYCDPDVAYPNENTLLDSDEQTLKLAPGEVKTVSLDLDASTLKKPDGYIEKEPQPNEGYSGPQRIINDEFFHQILVAVKDENGAELMSDIDATYASETSAKDTPGGYIEYKYNAPADGRYALRIFHSNDELCGEHPYNTKIIDRYMNIAVTDSSGAEISNDKYFFINTYSRGTFKEKTIMLDLKAGENAIRMYNDDSVSRWYGGDVAMPSQERQVNYAPNIEKLMIAPAAGVYDAANAPSESSPDYSEAQSGYVTEYTDKYLENAGFGTGDTAGWTAEGVTVSYSAANSLNGYYAMIEAGGTLSQTAAADGFYGNGFVSVYTKGENTEGSAYLVINENGTETRKELVLGNGYEATAIHHTFTGAPVEVSIDTSELTSGTVYADSFRITNSESDNRWNADSSTEYFVDCGDHFPESLCNGDRFGRRNSVTDRIYGLDDVTGYKWGVYVTDEDPAYYGTDFADNESTLGRTILGKSEGAWTKYQWPKRWGIDEQASKNDSYRSSFDRQTAENGFSGKHYIRYKFELEPGDYTITTGQQAMWWNGGPFSLIINGETVDTYSISSDDSWNTTVYSERTAEFTVKEGEDSALVSLESDADIWLTYIKIQKSTGRDPSGEQTLFEDNFAEDTSALYELPDGAEAMYYGSSLDVRMELPYDDGNGIRRDITEYLEGYSGETFIVSAHAGYFWESSAKLMLEVYGSNGERKTYVIADEEITPDDGTKVTLSGEASIEFGEDDRVYVAVMHPADYHSIDNISVKVKTVPEIYSEAELASAFAAGGAYKLGEAVISVVNSGLNGDVVSGSIDGGGNMLVKGMSKYGDAMLFHNNASEWVYSNMIIDGNKDNVTFTDACLWFNGADVTFENVTIRNFNTTAAERAAVFNTKGTVTFKDVVFEGNENSGENSEKYGEFTDILSMPWDSNAAVILKGSTKAKVYYRRGVLDVSGLGEGCGVSVKADNTDAYGYLKSLEYDEGMVNAEYNDDDMTVTFEG